ncbi:membrane protein [Pilimelia terevasa]|uniref:Membrane protein n=1 Tax=Pilimelia terevasa TaxID=53372 RepID=A0A8J3BP36_9ACTN|nr:PH domain-containing protein [Pilimelia terevasa]GGK25057.1 membrane protein [Pilimelia terevasa]
MTAPPEQVRLRPQRARLVCRLLAAAVFAVFAGVATVLRTPVNEGPATFGVADQVAMVLLGALGAAAILGLTRPRVVADGAGIRVRNLVGGYTLSWSVVRAVRFRAGAPWASLELHDDDLVPMMAIQAVDKQYAVDGLRRLRTLHETATTAR